MSRVRSVLGMLPDCWAAAENRLRSGRAPAVRYAGHEQ
jgi:hypothetical protein